jgi:hypothetical protein
MTNTIAMLDGVRIRIPGFIVPLEVDEQQRVTRFFVVPYFGACIHLPPPPPNQMIYVDVAKGVKIETISDPVWVSGELTTSIIENDMATAAYVMHIEAIASYEEVWDEYCLSVTILGKVWKTVLISHVNAVFNLLAVRFQYN